MNKGELVAKVAKDAVITKAQAEAAFNSLIEGVTNTLKKGRIIVLDPQALEQQSY